MTNEKIARFFNTTRPQSGQSEPAQSPPRLIGKQELEADRIGLNLINKARYNPRAAIEFWKRMKDVKQGKEPPVYLSTHPADDERIAQLEIILKSLHPY